MQSIKPRFPNDPSLVRPSKKARLVSQEISGDLMSTMATQVWEEPDGTEYELDINVDDNMLEGDVVSCSVKGRSFSSFGSGPVACSGVFIGTGMGRLAGAPLQIGASGLISVTPAKPEDTPTLEELEDQVKKDKVEGMNYDFTDTGIMKKKGSLDDK